MICVCPVSAMRRRSLFQWISSRGAAFAGRRNAHAGLGVFSELVPQGTDGNAEDIRRVRAVAEAMVERIQDEIAFDVRHRASDQGAGGGGGRFGGDGDG